MTGQDYYKITNCTPDFKIHSFSFEEVQSFLQSLGYQIIVNHAEAKTGHWTYNMGGESENWIGYEAMTDKILAIKQGEELPKRNDSDKAMEMGFISVFNKEIKKRLLEI